MAMVKVWDLPLRLFHWSLAVSILFAFVSAEEGSDLSQWHIASGWVAALLIGFRLLWVFIGGQHARFTSFIKPQQVAHHIRDLLRGRAAPSLGHNPLGGIAALALLIAVAAVVTTGAALTGGGETGEDLHEGIANGLLILIAVHVAGVIGTSLLTRDNLIKAMVTGNKSRARHPDAMDAAPAPGLAVPIAALALAAGTSAIVQLDPGAFAPVAHGDANENDDEADSD